MAMAMRASVTVSIAAEISGMFSAIARVTKVRVSAAAGSTSDGARHQQHVVEGQRLAKLHARSSPAASRPAVLNHGPAEKESAGIGACIQPPRCGTLDAVAGRRAVASALPERAHRA